jgi:phosphoglycerate dehydrogenase-like enzyme
MKPVIYAAIGAEAVRDACVPLGARVVDERDLAAGAVSAADIDVVFGALPRGARGARDLPRLRWFQAYGAGAEDAIAALTNRPDVTITNMSGLHATPIAEHAFGMLLMLTRALAASHRLQLTAHWDRNAVADQPQVLANRTLGILGLGSIGAACARLGRAFGMTTIGLRRSGEAHRDVDRVYAGDELAAMLACTDVLVNALPLTAATRGVLGDVQLRRLPRGAIVVNVGRGATLETDALVRALEDGHLGGAGLDVTDPEPLPDGHPLWCMPNVVITPHIGGAQPAYDESAAALFADNLRHYLNDEPLERLVDVSQGY